MNEGNPLLLALRRLRMRGIYSPAIGTGENEWGRTHPRVEMAASETGGFETTGNEVGGMILWSKWQQTR